MLKEHCFDRKYVIGPYGTIFVTLVTKGLNTSRMMSRRREAPLSPLQVAQGGSGIHLRPRPLQLFSADFQRSQHAQKFCSISTTTLSCAILLRAKGRTGVTKKWRTSLRSSGQRTRHSNSFSLGWLQRPVVFFALVNGASPVKVCPFGGRRRNPVKVCLQWGRRRCPPVDISVKKQKKKNKEVQIFNLVQPSWTFVPYFCKQNCNIQQSNLYFLFIAHTTVNRIVYILIVNRKLVHIINKARPQWVQLVTGWYPPGTEQFVRDQTQAGVANTQGVPHKHAQFLGSGGLGNQSSHVFFSDIFPLCLQAEGLMCQSSDC